MITRPKEIALVGANITIPILFPSVSTIKTNRPPSEYVEVLYSLREINHQFLVSAFDLHQSNNCESFASRLSDAYRSGTVILMDSGNYESYWKSQQKNWQPRNFHEMLAEFPCTFAFGFDDQRPPESLGMHRKQVIEQWKQDQTVAKKRTIVPIIHGDTKRLKCVCVCVAKETNVPMVAVAERDLGDGIFERMQSVIALRDALNSTGRYVGLHLLGTGNPISLALYSWAGADSFDGLEWCQTVVNCKTGLLFHFSHLDFFRKQENSEESEMSFQADALCHNLIFYKDWLCRLRNSVHDGEILNFLYNNLPDHVFKRCSDVFKWKVPR